MLANREILLLIVVLVVIFYFATKKNGEGFKYAGGSSGFVMNQSLSQTAAQNEVAHVFPGKNPPGVVRGLYGVDAQTLTSTHPQAWRTTIFNTLPATTATVLS
jgi:hypothetical protein